MFPEGTELPHETGLGEGELPPGEGCYSCNVGDKPLDVPLSKRNKRSVQAFLDSEFFFAVLGYFIFAKLSELLLHQTKNC